MAYPEVREGVEELAPPVVATGSNG